MKFWKKVAGGVAVSAITAAIVQPALAQETTSSIGGTVTTSTGQAVSGATVKVTDTRTGFARTSTTNSTGSFTFVNMNVGGPYTVDVSAPGQQPTRVEGIAVALGTPTSLNLAFSGAAAVDVVVITAQQANVAEVAIGPAMTFSLEDLESEPAINRDLKDIVRADPRIYLDETAGGTAGNDGIQCGGASPRFNSLTVDGIGLNDGFGLNNNGYPTERMPFPFDAINQVSVELAPFDVQYGGFTACAINAVTKSGTNEFHGGLFYDYTDDSLRGDSIEGRSVFVPKFEEKRYGVQFGGPIIPDRLFFYGAYEKFEGSNLFFRGPEGSGQPNIITGFTQAIYDQIVSTARNVYGFEPGGTPISNPTSDEKYLARLDWNINDRHRAALTYNYAKGLNLTESDTNQVTQFEFGNHLYDRGAELKATTLQLFSDWTDNFSTEFRIANNDVDATAACRDGRNIGEIQIQFSGRTIFMGCDDSRHSNDLDYTVLSIKGAATYRAGDHVMTFGAERQSFDIFNQFVQNTEGTFLFNSVASFISGDPFTIRYGNATSQNPSDATAIFGYDINTVYAQDEFDITPDFKATLGVRYDWYSSDDAPPLNANFVRRNGFANTENLDSKGILQPRFGATWDLTDRLTIRGGVGLFAGGNPNVWVSNSYSNDGLRNIQVEARAPLAAGFALAQNVRTTPNSADERGTGQTVNPTGAFWGIPTYLYNAVGSGVADSTVNAIDPDFQPAAEWKFSLGGTYDLNLGGWLGDDYVIDFDFIRSESKNAATVVDKALEKVGTNFDGTPLYKRIDRTDPDCLVAATVNTAACSTRSQNDLVLTNAGEGSRNIYSISVQKAYDWGFDWSFGYAHVDAEDTRSMTSSVAFSNWTAIAVTDINNPGVATSNYEIPNRFTMRLGYEHEWFEDFKTSISLYGQAYQARPYSYNFVNGGLNDVWGDGQESLHLLYVPTGPSDPNVLFCGGAAQANPLCRVATTGAGATQWRAFDTTGFFNWADSVGLARGQVVGRNDQEGSWTNKFDLKIEQSFPTGFGKGAVYAVFENIGNMIDDDWGVNYEAPFPQQTRIVEADRDPATGRYVYRQVSAVQPEGAVNAVSYWSVKLGARWNF